MKLSSLSWHPALDWGIEGRGWPDARRPFERLPFKARKILPPEVWKLGASATGLFIRFQTDAPSIGARWRLRNGEFNGGNLGRAAYSGLDLYVRDGKNWRWVAIAETITHRRPEQIVIEGLSPKQRTYLLYLPLRNPVSQLEIGVPPNASFKGCPPSKKAPLVYYGSSIVHGAYASRAGRVHPSLLGRRLDWPVINLGFSGQAKMHLPMAGLLGELNAAAFVIDPLPNMDPALVRERALPFLLELRRTRPTTPILLVEDFPLTNAWIKPSAMSTHREKWHALRDIYQKLKKAGDTNLHYLCGESLLGPDNEGTVDGIHPNDLGYQRLADALYLPLKSLLYR